MGTLFRAAGVQGTIVMYDLKGGRLTGYDLTRTASRFIPASTFVPHTLIGLSTARSPASNPA